MRAYWLVTSNGLEQKNNWFHSAWLFSLTRWSGFHFPVRESPTTMQTRLPTRCHVETWLMGDACLITSVRAVASMLLCREVVRADALVLPYWPASTTQAVIYSVGSYVIRRMLQVSMLQELSNSNLQLLLVWLWIIKLHWTRSSVERLGFRLTDI